MDSSKKVYLIDASAFVFRAYYALAPLSSKGRPSHAVQGFASMLLKLLREKKPKSCVIVFDSKKPSFRKEIFPEYKANREVPPPDLSDQIKAVMEMCKVAGFPILQEEGYEADDWIASFVCNAFPKEEVVIISSDKDLTQLVDQRVQMYDNFRDRLIGAKEVEEKWGVSPKMMRDLLVLVGDSSDNVPGVPGIGPKTASKLLNEFESIDRIYESLGKLPAKQQEKFKENEKLVELSKKLIDLKSDLEIPFKQLPDLPKKFPASFKKFLDDWELHRVVEQFKDVLDDSSSSSATVSIQDPNLRLISSSQELKELKLRIETKKRVSFDVESNSFNRDEARLVGASFCLDENESFYVPFRHSGQKVEESEVFSFLKAILQSEEIKKSAHNAKYDLQILSHEGIELRGLEDDTMILAYILHAARRSFSLDNLSKDFLGVGKDDLKELMGGSEDFSELELSKAVHYAAKDSWLCFKLLEIFKEQLKEFSQMEWLYRKLEIPCLQILARMETRGVLLNSSYLETLSSEMHERLSQIEKEIYRAAGSEFNIASPKQLSKILFEDLGLTPVKKTKTGYSTNEAVLLELEDEHEVPRLIVEFRKLSKLTSTYIDPLPAMISKVDGRLHTHYHQTGTVTGRLSSSDPNLQNIPTRSEEGRKIREAFIPGEGFVYFSADYSQIELRLMAHLSGDLKMIEAFKEGRDIHSETAKVIFGSDEKEFRSRAKAINFGVIYGISAFGLSQQLKISRADAKKFIDSYFEQFPRVHDYMEESIERARSNRYTETLFGRRRPLEDIHSKNPMLRQNAERIAINAPLQGTAADLMKWAMIRVDEELKQAQMKSQILLQVHDELILEVPVGEKDSIESLVQEAMLDFRGTPASNLAVPLALDSGFGANWAEL